MKAGRWIIIGLVIVVALIVLGQSLYTVDMTEQAVILQLGQYKKTVDKPGLHIKMPFIQSVTRMEKRVLVSDAPATGYLTMDKKNLVVDHVSRWRIVDPILFYKVCATEAAALPRLQAIVVSELRDEIASHDFADIISIQREPIMDTVTGRAREKALEFGIEVIDTRIKRADLPTEVQASVFDRMKAERQRMAMAYRAEGAEVSFKVTAQADREKTIIAAQAYEESQKFRGEGDAEATRIYAEAFGQDPEFYGFLRTLEAYETFLVGKTTLVLGSDSELFKYLVSSEQKE